MDTKALTQNEAIVSMNALVQFFIENGSIDNESLEATKYAVTNNIQFRDFLLGMPYHYDVPTMINLVQNILQTEDKDSEFAVALNTVLAGWLYEEDLKEESKVALSLALTSNPSYSLAQLLARVFSAGFTSESMTSMRSELHLKVLEGIKEKGHLSVKDTD